MGIKGFYQYTNKVLKTNWPRRVALEDLPRKRMAVDTMIVLCGFLYRARDSILRGSVVTTAQETFPGISLDQFIEEKTRQIMLNMVMNFINSFLTRGIVPVFVFDGVLPQDKREHEGVRRREKGQHTVDFPLRINSPLEQMFYEFLGDAGIPRMRATGEAERLCAALCRHGLVDAVYTTDSDVFAHGCPRMIKKGKETTFLKEGQVPMVEVYELDVLLTGLEVSFEEFREICILAGCDYNETIPRVAFARAVALIKQHGNIDQLPPERYDTAPLNHHRCRELFAPLVPDELVMGTIPDLQLQRRDGAELQRRWGNLYNITTPLNRLLTVMEDFEASASEK